MDLEPPDFSRLRLAFRDEVHGASTRSLERSCTNGTVERLRPGVLRDAVRPLSSLPRGERYAEARLRFLDEVNAVGLTRRAEPIVFSHRSAAAILGLPTVGTWPTEVDLLAAEGVTRRTRRGVRIHLSDFDEDEIMPWGPFFVTTPARTLADIARSGDLMSAVVALDSALNEFTRPLLRVGKAEVAGILRRHGGRGLARAEFAVSFADGRAANAGESASRVVIYQLGYEVPDLQVRHFYEGGYYDVDFEWPPGPRRPRPLIGEFDGYGKYVKPEYLGRMKSGDAVVKEKRREDVLRRQGSDFARWGWPEVRHPAELDRILRESGLRPIRRRLI